MAGRRATAAIFVLAVLVGGCLGPSRDEAVLPSATPSQGGRSLVEAAREEAAARVRALYGADALAVEDGAVFIARPVLLGMLDAGGPPAASPDDAWRLVGNLTLEVPPFVLVKDEPGPTGGGGGTWKLEPDASNITLWVQFADAPKWSDYNARWAVYQDPDAGFGWQGDRPADLPFSTRLPGPGVYFVAAQLLYAGQVVATVRVPYVASLNVHWVVESSVHPIKTGLAEGNTEEMSDKFFIDVRPGLPRLTAATHFRGNYSVTKGTDVDLEVDDPDQQVRRCSIGNGREANVTNPQQVLQSMIGGPELAREWIQVNETQPGPWLVRVGALRNGFDGDDVGCKDTIAYRNLANVPYALDLLLRYG